MADLYAKCPHCSTVFHVRADQLAAAHGQVRCGECGGLFNALLSLTEQIDEEDVAEGAAPHDEPFEEITLEGVEGDAPPGDDEAHAGDGERIALLDDDEPPTDAAAEAPADGEEEIFEFQLLDDDDDAPTGAADDAFAQAEDARAS